MPKLRDLARDLRDIAKRSPAYSMVTRPGLDIISVLEDHLCAMARIIELDNMIVTAPVAEQALLRKLEAMLADWDSDGGETYLDFAKRIICRKRIP